LGAPQNISLSTCRLIERYYNILRSLGGWADGCINLAWASIAVGLASFQEPPTSGFRWILNHISWRSYFTQGALKKCLVPSQSKKTQASLPRSTSSSVSLMPNNVYSWYANICPCFWNQLASVQMDGSLWPKVD